MFDGIAEGEGRKTELPIAFFFNEISFFFFYCSFLIYLYLTIWSSRLL